MDIYLVDGTYELFRHFYAVPQHENRSGEEVGAARGVLNSLAGMLDSGITHIGVATDHVIESFRNKLWPNYKTSEGVDPRLLAQFPLLEDAVEAMGITVWPMVELEADDALAGAASSLVRISKVGRIFICTPDKDLAQCVSDDRIIQLDRRNRITRNEVGVMEKFGVGPKSIPDYLALVGDSADGYPGLEGWGEKSASAILSHYKHLEAIPPNAGKWEVQPRNASRLATTLQSNFKLALLFRDLATLRIREPKLNSPEELHWKGPQPSFTELCERINDFELKDRVLNLATSRGHGPSDNPKRRKA